MKRLPNTLHGLLKVALDDLEKCMADKDYYIDMREWHTTPHENGKCNTCLAGSVIAKTLGVPKGQFALPCFFNDGIKVKLRAIDRMRNLLFDDAWKLLSKSFETPQPPPISYLDVVRGAINSHFEGALGEKRRLDMIGYPQKKKNLKQWRFIQELLKEACL